MAWYKSAEWQACIEAFDAWFSEAVEYVNSEGEYDARRIGWLSRPVIDALLDVAKLDPMPVWDVTRFIENRRQHAIRMRRGYPEGREIVSLPEIEDRLQQVQMYRDRIMRVGVTGEKPQDEEAAVELERTERSVPPAFRTKPLAAKEVLRHLGISDANPAQWLQRNKSDFPHDRAGRQYIMDCRKMPQASWVDVLTKAQIIALRNSIP